MNKSQWQAKLKAFSQELYRSQLLPPRDTLAPEAEWQCRIIGGDLIGWQQYALPHIMNERNALRIGNFDPHPVQVFTSTIPGLVAACEILNHIGESAPDIIYLPHDSFMTWCREHSLSRSAYIHQWSYFQPPSDDALAKASEKYETIPPQEFRLHTSGDLWGENCGTEQSHLWRWNGQEMELIEEAFMQIMF
jgi:hypothetical protein